MSDLLKHQIEYYRARAPEYDEWFYRHGRYDHGPAQKQQWECEAQQVRDQLHSVSNLRHILEMAPGTGIWTQELIQIGERVTALDASPEMININRAKLLSDKVDYQLTDLFEWRPDRQYDMVFFGFWISHVPGEKLSRFLATVHAALKPGGRLFFVDSAPSEQSTSAGQSIETRDELQKRVLKDGRQFDIVKIYYDPPSFTKTLRAHGFDIEVKSTANFFIYADGRKCPA